MVDFTIFGATESDVSPIHRQVHTPAHPAPGTLIAGSYRLEFQLGLGGMGVVFLARDETLDRAVAVKFIHPNLLDETFRARFADEARAMARVSHPNVVQVHAFGEHEGSPYIVMELIEGSTLERWIAERGGAADIDAAIDILDGLCQGVAAIHAADTVHRDIKPGNVLLDVEGRPRITDMGVAVLCNPHEPATPEVVGTPSYMAPEIVFGAEVTPALRARADVYSLACVAYELFTGRPPFDASGSMGIMMHQASTPAEPPSTRRPDLPREIDNVLLRALVKEPEERTPSVRAFRAELLAARAGWCEPVRILVAEDDEDFRELLEIVLTQHFPGADVECVSDGDAALRAFNRAQPSVVLLDLCMPGIDGMELTRIFRAGERTADMPIIVLTAAGGPREWKHLSELGADRFMVKPLVLDDVVDLVRRSLGERVSGVVPRLADWKPPIAAVALPEAGIAS